MERHNKKTHATLTHYLIKFKKDIILAALPLTVTCGMVSGASLVAAQVFQRVFEGDLPGLIKWMLLLAGLWFLIQGVHALYRFLEARALRRLNNALRADMAAALIHMSHQEYHSEGAGEYLSRFTNDVNQIENLAWKPFFQLVEYSASAVFSVIALLTIHWSLVLAALATTALMLFVPQLFNRRMERLGKVCSDEQARATGILKDLLSGRDVLCSFGRERRFTQGAGAASEGIERTRFRLGWVKGLVGAGVSCVNVVCQVTITGLVGLLAIWGYTQPGSLAAGGNLCGALSNSLGSIAGLLLSFSSARPYFEKIPLAGDTGSQAGPGMGELGRDITLEDISFRYGEHSILQDLSLRFKKGGKYAITGPSGCGKSTLLKLLLGWLPEYTGTIRFDGRDARDFTPEQLQQEMSYIEQNVFLFNSTIRDNITLGEKFSDEQMERALRDSALANDLEAIPDGLDAIVGEEGGSLSGGQKQRVAIARALIHDRSILLVDEGTSALDQANADIVERSLLSNPGLTLILVSHHLTEERKRQFTGVYELGT